MENFLATPWLITTPADLLVAVPYLLGFHPDQEAVLVAFRDTRLVYIAGAELPAPGTDPARLRDLVASIAARVADHQATSIVMLGYGPPERVTPIMDVTAEVVGAAGLAVGDLLRVTDGRYHSYVCTNPSCCPPEGTVVDPTTSVIAAQATACGRAPLPSRASVIARVAAVTGRERQAMRQATDRARSRLDHEVDRDRATPATVVITRLGAEAISTALRDPQRWPLPDDEAAWLTLLISHSSVRDVAWSQTAGHPEHLPLWVDLTRRAESALLGNTAGICALCAWDQGDHILGNAAVARVVHDDPTHDLAVLATTPIDDLPAGAGDQPPVAGQQPSAPVEHRHGHQPGGERRG